MHFFITISPRSIRMRLIQLGLPWARKSSWSISALNEIRQGASPCGHARTRYPEGDPRAQDSRRPQSEQAARGGSSDRLGRSAQNAPVPQLRRSGVGWDGRRCRPFLSLLKIVGEGHPDLKPCCTFGDQRLRDKSGRYYPEYRLRRLSLPRLVARNGAELRRFCRAKALGGLSEDCVEVVAVLTAKVSTTVHEAGGPESRLMSVF